MATRNKPTLIILGASARAAAASAIRAGFLPWTADLFADVDLMSMVPDAIRCPVADYPNGFVEILKSAPHAPWIYTGALENHPNLIRQLSEIRPLWGNGPNALLACRSPFRLERILREASLPALPVRHFDSELSMDCRWLKKPLRGSAGQGISFEATPASTHYFQQHVEGTPMSAIFVCARGAVKLLGVSEQLIGTPWLNAPPFRYSGNIGPIEISAQLRDSLLEIGTVIGVGCDLLGLFGIDFVKRDGQPWVVEVNPRYTASIEVLEKVSGIPFLELHAEAFDNSYNRSATTPGFSISVGKAILYADQDLKIPNSDWIRSMDPEMLADIPHSGEFVPSGWPILTILSRFGEPLDCREELRRTAKRILQQLASRAQ